MILDELWGEYARHVPYVGIFEKLAGAALQNDHVAFRSRNLEPIARAFEELGWRRAGAYDFPDAHLDAIHLTKAGSPRIFVSQLRTKAFSPRVAELLAELPPDPPFDGKASWFRKPDLLFSEAEILELERESHYAAWLALFGREVNHFTASVPDVELWQRRMSEAGIPMKSEIEGEKGAKFRQTATKAAPRRVRMSDKERDWPYAYLEIAQRSPDFDGFVPKQARQLFDMTRR
jgi:hypothetical protein